MGGGVPELRMAGLLLWAGARRFPHAAAGLLCGATFDKLVEGRDFSQQMQRWKPADWLLVFTGGGHTTLAAWTTGTAHAITDPTWGTLNLSVTPFYVNPVPEPGAARAIGHGADWTARVGVAETKTTDLECGTAEDRRIAGKDEDRRDGGRTTIPARSGRRFPPPSIRLQTNRQVCEAA